jgi:hypothetical protein
MVEKSMGKCVFLLKKNISSNPGFSSHHGEIARPQSGNVTGKWPGIPLRE